MLTVPTLTLVSARSRLFHLYTCYDGKPLSPAPMPGAVPSKTAIKTTHVYSIKSLPLHHLGPEPFSPVGVPPTNSFVTSLVSGGTAMFKGEPTPSRTRPSPIVAGYTNRRPYATCLPREHPDTHRPVTKVCINQRGGLTQL